MTKKNKNPEQVQKMFGRISKRYELMNYIITFGQVSRWRDLIIEAIGPVTDGSMLDAGTGTGAIACLAKNKFPGLLVFGLDFTKEMLTVAEQNRKCGPVSWVMGDALTLPFPDGSFNVVTSGYLIRNVTDVDKAFSEQKRVLKPGGTLICLDTSPPRGKLSSFASTFYMMKVVPLLGQIIGGDKAAYEYLPGTTKDFMTTDELAEKIKNAGLDVTSIKKLMFSTQSLIKAVKTD